MREMAESAGSAWAWPDGLAAAVSLSYDGTLLCHLETVVPHLDRYGLRGTFYAVPERLLEALKPWQEVQLRGHEIANGCLFPWASADGSLDAWTLEMVAADIGDAESLIEESFPSQRNWSFAFPCGHPRCARGQDYREIVEAFAGVARSGIDGFNIGPSCDIRYLKRVYCSGFECHEILSMVQMAIDRGEWAILAFEGVGVGDRAVDASSHERLCEFLDSVRDRVWLDPVVSIGNRLRTYRGQRYHLV